MRFCKVQDTILTLHNRRKLESRHKKKQKQKDEQKTINQFVDANEIYKLNKFYNRELTQLEKEYIEAEFEPNDFEKRILEKWKVKRI